MKLSLKVLLLVISFGSLFGCGGGEEEVETQLSEKPTPTPIIDSNTGPIAVDDSTSTEAGVSLFSIDVLGNDFDSDGDSLFIENITATGGSAFVNPDGTIDFVPASEFIGIAQVIYQVSDGKKSASGTLYISIADVVGNSLVEISWSMPGLRENGDFLLSEDVEAFEVLYKLEADTAFKSIIIDAKNVDITKSELSLDLAELPPGIWEFKVAVIDVNGLSSEYSDLILAEI